LLRLKLRGESPPAKLPQALPLEVLTAAREHVPTLVRTGCRSWDDLRSLPRAGVARRFGAALLDALDAAYGEKPERYPWLTLPEEFDLKCELAALATTAPELMWSAQRLLTQLQVWLQARHRGVLALELEWTLDLRRLNGVKLPSHEQLTVRTAQPTQDIAHLRRLVGEHLSRASLSAPANHLRLRSIETMPWGGADKSLLPEDNVKGERLHQLVERLSVRLGEGNVVVPQAQADHRPERMQKWTAAKEAVMPDSSRHPGATDSLYPSWLLPEPLRLEVRGSVPHYGGPLRRLARLYRVETGWWEDGKPALRDYFIARSEEAGLVWIYRERPPSMARGLESAGEFHWYLQGLYA
jgi:protein ImuB